VTSLAGVGRVDRNQRDARVNRLIFKERPELMERPRLLLVSLGLADLGSLPDPGQFLNGDRSSGLLGLVHDATGNNVVNVGGMLPFASREPFQEPLCPFSAFGLNGTPDLGIVVPDPVDLRGLENLPIAIDRDSPSSQVHPKRSSRFDRLGSFIGQLDMEVVPTVSPLDQDCRSGLTAL